MIGEDKKKYTVTKTIPEAPGVVSLELSCDTLRSLGEVGPLYIPGQFITVYLPELGTPEGKPTVFRVRWASLCALRLRNAASFRAIYVRSNPVARFLHQSPADIFIASRTPARS